MEYFCYRGYLMLTWMKILKGTPKRYQNLFVGVADINFYP